MKNKHNNRSSSPGPGLSRRTVLGGSAALAAASVMSGQAKASSRRGGTGRPTLIQVFMRQGMDGLTAVVPYADSRIYALRPTLAIQPPGPSDGAVDLDGFFGLAPAAAPFLTPYSNGHLAIVHASGSHDPTRSHFEAFSVMEIADPNLPPGITTNGWVTRYLELTEASAVGSIRAISADRFVPYSLRGAPKSLPIPDFENFFFPGLAVSAMQRQAAIVDAYSRRRAPVGTAALDTIATFGLGGVDFAGYVPEDGAMYPDSIFGRRMRHIAALIKADIGVEAFAIDTEGWDLHANLGPVGGPMAHLLDDLSSTLEAFYLDMLAYLDDYVLVALSEFGRHGRENASAGLDHGHGNAMFVLGGHVNGGQVIADWPGLESADLDSGDLAVTTDYRDILGEVLVDRLGLTPAQAQIVFPSHTFTDYNVTT